MTKTNTLRANLTELAKDAGLPVPQRPPVIVYGDMLNDCETIREELKRLMFNANEFHSKLRVIRGAAKRIQDAVDALGLDK